MGKVKLGVHNVTGEKVAVKIVPRANFQQFSQASHLAGKSIQQIAKEKAREENREVRTIREAHMMMLLKHPNIVGLKDLVLQGPYFYILMDYVNGSQLLHYIVKRQRLSENRTRHFSRQIVSALDYLHRNSIAHRDLKIENIMVDKSGRNIKIIDFGLSNLFCPERQLTTFCGSLYFAAPELLKANPYTGPEVDIWSLGVVIFVMATGSVPFDDKSMPGLHDKIKKGHVQYPEHLNPGCTDLLSSIFIVDPSKRIVMTDIVNHPWLNKDAPPINNHMPVRRPLSLPLDANVVERMSQGFNLGSGDEIQKRLTLIVQSPVYQEAAKQMADIRGPTTPTASQSNLNSKSVVVYDDPLSVPAAYHPLVSLYHLAAEKQNQMESEAHQHQRRLTIRASLSKKASVESLNGGYSSARSSQASLVDYEGDHEGSDPSNTRRPLMDVPLGQTPVMVSANNNGSGIGLNGDGSLLGFASQSAAISSTNYLSRIQRWLRSSLSQHHLSSSGDENVSTPPSPPQHMDDAKHSEVEALDVSHTKSNRLPTPTHSIDDKTAAAAPPLTPVTPTPVTPISPSDAFYGSSNNATTAHSRDSYFIHSQTTIPNTPTMTTSTSSTTNNSKSLFHKISQAFFRKGSSSSKSLHKKTSNLSSTSTTIHHQDQPPHDLPSPPPVPPKDPQYMVKTPIHDARKSQQLPPGMSMAKVTSRQTAHTIDITALNQALYKSGETAPEGKLTQDAKYVVQTPVISNVRRGSVSKITGKLGSWMNNRSRSNSFSHQSVKSEGFSVNA
ncbi:Pkinase-domain-containing protein [Backusella circina FSU 941]|nr:Pkinase-domain-containing protein [Backusella circina FSU 941]